MSMFTHPWCLVVPAGPCRYSCMEGAAGGPLQAAGPLVCLHDQRLQGNRGHRGHLDAGMLSRGRCLHILFIVSVCASKSLPGCQHGMRRCLHASDLCRIHAQGCACSCLPMLACITPRSGTPCQPSTASVTSLGCLQESLYAMLCCHVFVSCHAVLACADVMPVCCLCFCHVCSCWSSAALCWRT